MKQVNDKSKLKNFIDNVLLINLFLVIIFSIAFVFSVIMQFYGSYIFLDFFNKLWNPLIVPLITLLILASLISGINDWLQKRVHSQEEDI